MSDRGAGGAFREHGRSVGDADVEPVGEAGHRGTDQLARDDGTCDEPREGVAPLSGRAERKALREDGDEGVDADPAVAGQADRSREPGLPVVRAVRSASPSEGSEPRSSTSRDVAAGSCRTSGYVKGAPAGASMRICSVGSTSPRCAAATSGTQPTAAISGRASGTRANVENASGPTDDEAS